MRIPLDRDSPVPLYRQIQQFLREQIRSGSLPSETRLPASRKASQSQAGSQPGCEPYYGDQCLCRTRG